MKKQISVLITELDEETFSYEINRLFPSVGFIDDMYWESSVIPERASITQCKSKYVFIWNKDIYRDLPRVQRFDGKFIGPQSGQVIQMIRSTNQDPTSVLPKANFLSSGRLAIGIDNNEVGSTRMIEFVNQIWKILKKITTKKLFVVNLDTKGIINDKPFNIVAGKNAVEWCKADPNRYFKFQSVQVYMRPSEM